ncbi:23 kDa integral membrane protein-like [Ostrinia furnacalis]|uniref:23 kDa integral membrane protein-like n=1 Tax=Ostrinia furnacalis TaxID=93504 RepID=UPI00103D57BD|nr:23 kDa integral membrane protein-like [Ostrinia furnacalis]
MSCCAQYIIKYILFAVNLIFALGGLALLILGVIVQVQVSDVVSVASVNISVAPISSMVIGSVIFFIAFLGCCGAIKENRCFLLTYAVFMVLLMIVKITLGTVIFVSKEDVVADVPQWLGDTFVNNRTDFYDIQTSFQCCGTVGPQVYLPDPLPASCCAEEPCLAANAFDGCNQVIQDYLSAFLIAIGAVLLVVAGIELVAAIFCFCLSRHIDNKRAVQIVN